MYKVKFFIQGLMTHPCEHRFKHRADAFAMKNDVEKQCINNGAKYLVEITRAGNTLYSVDTIH